MPELHEKPPVLGLGEDDGLPPVLGDRRLVAIARDLSSWGGLCEFITAARTAKAPKGQYQVSWEASRFEWLQGCEILLAPRREAGCALDLEALCARIEQCRALFDG